jgi:NADH-quinone oxidoreductase subunit M
MNEFPWLSVAIAVPLLGAGVLWALPARSLTMIRSFAVGLSAVPLAIVIGLLVAFDRGGARFQFSEKYTWISSFGIHYAVGVDGVALALLGLTVLLSTVCLVATCRSGPGGLGQPRGEADDAPATEAVHTAEGGIPTLRALQRCLAWMLVLEALLIGVFAATDVFLFYVLFEAMLIPMYVLIGSFGGPQRSYAAMKFLLYSLAGGLVMLVAVVMLGVKGPGGENAYLFDTLRTAALDQNSARWMFVAFFIAFAIKAPLWPVHTWLPSAASQAPAPASVLLVGVMDKVGTFGMLRYCLELFPEASRWATPVIVALAVVGVLYGALLALGQVDLYRFIAYTSVSHFGFITLGIFALTSQSQTGSMFYMINHGLATGMLFLLAGMMVARRGSQRIVDYRGMGRVNPVLGGLFLVAALATIALPGLSTFVSEFLVLLGSYPRYPVAAVAATLGVVLAAIYMLLLYQRVMTGPTAPAHEGHPDLSARERWLLAPLVGLLVALGFYPQPMLDVVKAPVQEVLQRVQATDPAPVHPAPVVQTDEAHARTDEGSQP